MPSKRELAERGGAVRVRTMTMSDGSKRKVYVVRKKGPKGGHTVMAPEQTDTPVKMPKRRKERE